MSQPRVYFYCCPEPDNLQDDIIILAEGLRALGIPYYASANYWRLSPDSDDFLFKATPEVSPDDCDVVVFPYTWFNWVLLSAPRPIRRPFPEGIFKKGRKYRTVYMDTNDGLRTVSWEPEFRNFDLILRTKYNRRVFNPSNLRPWVLGLSNRMVQMTAGGPAFEQRRRAMMVNFGASHGYPHGARTRAHEKFDPLIGALFDIESTKDDLSIPPDDAYDRLMWEQTNHRHARTYYARMKACQAVSCFCGDLIPPMPWLEPYRLMQFGNRAKIRRAFYEFIGHFDPRPERISQWDSWRFWEALGSGCAAFNLDLERYGAQLPVMPIKDEHYFGVNLSRPEASIDALVENPSRLSAVASSGRKWALANYSPEPMARRFLREAGLGLAET
ncbi:MAG TPA: hypothetical protein VFE25_09650 [Opitutaceae bacterium]|jgi:hypothetical protein|nr:hypothetical protein [Opitutaceae bacterium]